MAIIESTIRLRDRFSSTLRRMNGGLSNAIGNMHRFANSQQIVNQRTNLAGSSVDRLTKSLGGLSAAFLAVNSAKSLIAMGDAYIGNTARIDLMNDGLQTTAELQQKIYQASQRSLTDYNKMSSVVSKLGITAKHAFSNNDEMIAFAELVNKQFTISGASPSERSNAMYQLTQAMASGRLQGDEFRSILENAPLLAQTIADAMGQPFEKMRELSADGKITADIIKKALFSTAEETNKRFSQMPMQFGDLWMQVTNKINRGLEPVYIRLRELWNDPKVQSFFDMIANGFSLMMRFGLEAFNVITSITSSLGSMWSRIEPFVLGFGNALSVLIIPALWRMVAATWAAVSGWLILNYPILIIGAAIGILITVLNQFGIKTEQVVGYVTGAFSALGAFLWNVFLGVLNIAGGMFQGLMNWGYMFANFFANVFENPVSSLRNLFFDFGDTVLGVLQRIASAIDLVFGSKLAETVSGWRSSLKKSTEDAIKREAPNENYKAIVSKMDEDITNLPFIKRLGYGESYKAGFDFASNFSDNLKVKEVISGFEGSNLGNIGTAMKNANMPMLDELKKIAGNTKSSATSLTRNNEDMSYLRQLAERDAINKYTSNSVNVNMTNNNKVNSKLDLDKVVDYLGEKVYDTMLSTAEGVHI